MANSTDDESSSNIGSISDVFQEIAENPNLFITTEVCLIGFDIWFAIL